MGRTYCRDGWPAINYLSGMEEFAGGPGRGNARKSARRRPFTFLHNAAFTYPGA